MQIGRFHVLQSVHDGIYGSVLQAETPDTGQRAAVQIFSRPGLSDERFLQALKAHLQTLHRLSLPGTPLPLDCGRIEDGRLYLIVEWVEGRCLQVGQPAVPHPLRLAQQLAASLEAAHQHGIYHLLLRPSQIIVTAQGQGPRCMVLGLGLAGLLGPPGATLSAEQLAFLAPERRAPAVVASSPGAADVYSLGMLLRVLLGLPIQGPVTQLAGAGDLLEPASRDALGKLLEHVLARAPEQRPSMAEVNARLHELSRSRRRSRTSAALPLVAATPPALAGAGKEDPLLGQVFGKFVLTRRLGSGAMGTVYEAKHQLIQHRAAVKVMQPQFTEGPQYARRFMDEARAVNIVEHPSLVSIFEFGQRDDGLLYIVMEFLRGETLEATLARGPLRPSAALPLGLQCARALAAAHQRGVVHRDLKPGNIMLVPDPLLPDTQRIKILDFGIAKVEQPGEDPTQTGAMMGTPRYMAPEQYGNAEDVDGKADVFALGVVLFEMLSGKSPFGEASSFAVVQAAPSAVPMWRAGIPSSVALAISRMLNKDARLRPSMAEVVLVLERALDPRRLRLRLFLVVAPPLGLLAAVLVLAIGRQPSLLTLQKQQADVRSRSLAVLQRAIRRSSEEPTRVAATQALGSTRDPAQAESLAALTQDPSAAVGAAAIAALGELSGAVAGEKLVSLLSARDRELQLLGALSLARARSQPRRLREQGRSHLLKLLRALPEHDEHTGALRLDLTAALYLSAQPPSGEATSEPQSGELAQTRELAWQALAEQGLAEPERLGFLEQWAQLGDPQALSQLTRLADQDKAPPERLRAIASLLGQHSGTAAQRSELLAAAQTAGPLQLLAARLLAQVQGDAGCTILAEFVRQKTAAKQESRATEQLKLAADGLSFCRLAEAKMLLPLLDGADLPPILPVTAARSLLHVVGLDPESSAQAQLGAISPYLNSSSRSDRLTAIALLATLAGEQGVAELGAALRDPDELVRAASATALGQRRVLGALNALTSALTDANTSVRRSGLRAITQLLDSLKPTSGSQLPRVAIAALRQRLQGAVDAAEKIIIQMVLLRCGESVSLKNIEEVLASGSEEQRLLVVELLPEDSPLLHSALRDPSAKVRFFAARRRVEQHARDAVPVLTEMLKRPGEEAILSYWLLRQLGVSAKAPEQLSEFLQRSSLPTRRDAVLLLAELPVNEALPFLLQACTDPAEVVRGAVAQSAWRLYEKTRDPRLFDLLSRLTTDPELPVRMKALALVGLLRPAAPSPVASVPAAPPAEAPRGEAPPAPAVPDPPPRADGGMAPSSLAQLLVLLPTGVRGRLENQRGEVRREVISGQQLQLPPDRYLLLSCGESVPITLHAGQSVTQRSPCSAEPLLREARQARRSGDYSSAQRSVEQALKRLDRTQAPQLYDLLRFEHGEIKAASGGLREALGDWNAVWERYRGSPPSEVPSIDKKFAELHGRVGRLTVHTSEGGPCRKVYDGLLMPGDGQKMTLGKAKLVFDIKPGVPTTKNLCGSGPK